MVSVPPGGTNPTWRHVNPPKGKKKGKKSVKINPEVEMEIIEAEDDAEGEAVSVLPVKLLESGKDR